MSRSRRHTPIGPFFCCNSNHISEKLEKRWRNRMIRAAARNALVRALRLNECLEDVEALYAEPKPWCFIKLYGTEKEGKYWYSFANTPEGAKEQTQFMRKQEAVIFICDADLMLDDVQGGL